MRTHCVTGPAPKGGSRRHTRYKNFQKSRRDTLLASSTWLQVSGLVGEKEKANVWDSIKIMAKRKKLDMRHTGYVFSAKCLEPLAERLKKAGKHLLRFPHCQPHADRQQGSYSSQSGSLTMEFGSFQFCECRKTHFMIVLNICWPHFQNDSDIKINIATPNRSKNIFG